MAKILIGCRLPHGLTLTHPTSKKTVTIDGLNKLKVIGSTHAVTEVDADFWATWKTVYSDYKPLKNGSLFEARGVREADDKGKELAAEKTGFEPMAQDTAGVKKATEE